MKLLIISFGLFFLPEVAFTQVVITVPTRDLDGPNGFALDSSDKLYIASDEEKK